MQVQQQKRQAQLGAGYMQTSFLICYSFLHRGAFKYVIHHLHSEIIHWSSSELSLHFHLLTLQKVKTRSKRTRISF